jgi:hypothetical protein
MSGSDRLQTTAEAWSPFKTPPYAGWAPYCLMCNTMQRMRPTDYGWQCRVCRNPIGQDGTHDHGQA